MPLFRSVLVVAMMAALAVGRLSHGMAAEDGGGAREPQPSRHSEAAPGFLLDSLSLTSSRAPVTVTANTLEFDYRSRVLTYTGAVVVQQGDVRLRSETLVITLDRQSGHRVKEVVAHGRVHLSQGARWATGGRAVFDQGRGTVVLSDNAELHEGANQVSGDRIVVYLNEERSVVEGGSGRVKALLLPPGATADADGGTP